MKYYPLIFVGMLFVLSACKNEENVPVTSKYPGGPAREIKLDIFYFQDPRTGLCFAQNSKPIAYNYSLTCVPCTKEIKKLLLNP